MTRTVSFLAALTLSAAACYPAGEAPAAAALPDSASVHTAIQALSDAYEAAELAGDAAAVAALYTENGTAAFEGVPTSAGRAAVQESMTGYFSLFKVSRADIPVQVVAVHSPTVATASGLASFDVDSSGVTRTDTWRWAAEYTLGSDSQWRISYIIGFREAPAAPQ